MANVQDLPRIKRGEIHFLRDQMIFDLHLILPKIVERLTETAFSRPGQMVTVEGAQYNIHMDEKGRLLIDVMSEGSRKTIAYL